MPIDKPLFFFVLGPSGAGKSEVFTRQADIDSFNKDLVLQRLSGGASRSYSREVRWLADAEERQFWDKHLSERISFAAERTFRHSSDLESLVKPREAGFQIAVNYISAGNAETHIKRAQNRVNAGGHYVSPEEIRDIHTQSLRNLTQLFEATAEGRIDVLTIYDNERSAKRVLAVEDNEISFLHSRPPAWLTTALENTPFNVPALSQAKANGDSLSALDIHGERRRAALAVQLVAPPALLRNSFASKIGEEQVKRDLESVRERIVHGAEIAAVAAELAARRYNNIPGSAAYTKALTAAVNKQIGPTPPFRAGIEQGSSVQFRQGSFQEREITYSADRRQLAEQAQLLLRSSQGNIQDMPINELPVHDGSTARGWALAESEKHVAIATSPNHFVLVQRSKLTNEVIVGERVRVEMKNDRAVVRAIDRSRGR
jgi:predicted ABC-type ATPase